MKIQYRIYDHQPPWGTGMLMRQSRDGSALIRTADGETIWRRSGQWREVQAAAS